MTVATSAVTTSSGAPRIGSEPLRSTFGASRTALGALIRRDLLVLR